MAKEAQAQVQLKDFQNIFSLEGKVAVVTGGSRGLGLHAASGLLQAGASKVYISSRKAAACDEAVAALNALPNKRPGAQAIAVPADGSKMAELDRLVAEVSKTTDHVDILFANAGATWGAPYDEYPENAFSKVMDLNVKGVFYTIQKYARFFPVMPINVANLRKIHPPASKKSYTRRPFASHHHRLCSWHRHRRHRSQRNICVLRLQSSSYQSGKDSGRRIGSSAHSHQRHCSGFLSFQNGEWADGIGWWSRGIGGTVSQWACRSSGGYCRIGRFLVESCCAAY